MNEWILFFATRNFIFQQTQCMQSISSIILLQYVFKLKQLKSGNKVRMTMDWPDRLNPDWCRLRTGWLGCLAGEVLAEEAGVMALGVTDTSQTGPSYSPLGTPLSSASCNLRKQTRDSKNSQWKMKIYSIPKEQWRLTQAQSVASCVVPSALHKTVINHYKKWWSFYICLWSNILPCCELLSSCRHSQGKVYGPHSVPTPRWCGGSRPPTRSCPGWWPPGARHAPLCLQRCCIPQSVEERRAVVKHNEKVSKFSSEECKQHQNTDVTIYF